MVAVISGCTKSPKDEVVLVTIGDTDITLSDVRERIAYLPERYREVAQRKKEEYLQGLINDTLLYQEALRKGLQKDKDVRRIIEEARKKIIIARLLKDEVDDKIAVTEDDVNTFYEKNRDSFMTPEVIRASHILVPTDREAYDILRKLENGAVFEDMAKAKSVDPTAQRGGDIGYFSRGQLMPEFEEACVSLQIGDISGVVKTRLGYHIIKLTDRRPPESVPIERVSEDIRAQLNAIKRQGLFNSLLERLRSGTKIKVYNEVLSGDHSSNTGNDTE